ncbi:hypothetical protein RKLH11_2536 [Rhodobacteraceae bacterium KLH11]|nr:hypothetical protein RKLH11_2536 [Rhodobacteraceae bacterium KLH11]
MRLNFDRYTKLRKSTWREFGVGNAGDIFARNLVSHHYHGSKALNVTEGPRLLCVGSIAHKLAPGDILCGIGCKDVAFPAVDPETVKVQGVRGPITATALHKAGYDVSQIKWHGDPGLKISQMLNPESAKPGRAIFIPHYRERGMVRKVIPKWINMVDIDDDPLRIGREIMRAELVYSSSLHGIIFAHALGRPVVMVKPATEEPLLKFDDYFFGVGLARPRYLSSITEADIHTKPNSPASLSVSAEDLIFPTAQELESRGIMTTEPE